MSETILKRCVSCGVFKEIYLFSKDSSKKDLCIDHSHETDEVRGCLCGKCNRALGLLDEDVDRVLNLMNYIRRWF
jgi:hypothetical protein